MFERFTERARQVVVLAQEEARTLKHNYIGTEHILLGLLREGKGLGAQVLANLDVTEDEVRRRIAPGQDLTTGQIPFTPRAMELLNDGVIQRALNLGHNYIGTEHELLAFAPKFGDWNPDEEDAGVSILINLGVSAEQIRSEVIRMLTGPGVQYKPVATAEVAAVEAALADLKESVEALAGLDELPGPMRLRILKMLFNVPLTLLEHLIAQAEAERVGS